MTDHVVSHTIRVSAVPSAVWRALTEPAELIQWYAPGCRWEIPELRAGATLKFFNTETDIQRAIVERCDPPRELTLRWFPDAKLPETSLLNTCTLRADNGWTVATISQTGYASVPASQQRAWIHADEVALPAIASALAAFCSRDRPAPRR